MLGLLWGAIAGSKSISGAAKAASENNNGKRIASETDKERKEQGLVVEQTYVDRLGAIRSSITDENVRYEEGTAYGYKGDRLILNQRGGLIRNLSEQQRQEDFEYRKRSGKFKGCRAILYNPRYFRCYRRTAEWPHFDYIYMGETYKDLKRGKLYVRRRFDIKRDREDVGWCTDYDRDDTYYSLEKETYAIFYMDMRGRLVALADVDKPWGKDVDSSDVVNFMKKFNALQETEGYNIFFNIESEDPVMDRSGIISSFEWEKFYLKDCEY